MATIVFPDHPSPVADAEALRKAFQGSTSPFTKALPFMITNRYWCLRSILKGWGTDEAAIIAILGRRNSVQRKLIREAYENLYQEDLVKRLESELSGDFERAVYRWILDPEDCNAVLLHTAIKKHHLDYRVVVEIATINSPEELLAIKQAYQIRYNHSLEEDLAQHTKADLRKLLVGLVSTYRYGSDEINAGVASSEAHILHRALEEKAFNDEEVIRVITTRSKPQVLATLNKYKDAHGDGSSITKHLGEDRSSSYLSALRIALQCITDHVKYYEKVIRVALKGIGTDEDSVTRVVVTRAEKDLRQIKEVFEKRNGLKLEHAVAKDTSGHYKAFLLTLLGQED